MDNRIVSEETDYGIAYYSKVNSNFAVVPYGELISDYDEFLIDNHMLDEIKVNDLPRIKTVYACIHISSQCNLKCRYCFNIDRKVHNLSKENVRNFINIMYGLHPNANRYIIDLSGSGEPLLNKPLIKFVCDLCKEYSDKYLREFQPRLVTNGTLLTYETIDFLQNNGVLFGISIDGNKKQHNFNRIDRNGNGTYKSVIDNIKRIKDKRFVGAAVTLTNENCNIVRIVKSLIKYFPTIAIKPVRYLDGSDFEIDIIKYRYEQFNNFLIRKTLNGDLRYIRAILNGDDYFGKFIFRIYNNIKALTRCDASISRLALSSDGKIYICPGAEGNTNFEIGNINDGLDNYKRGTAINRQCFGLEECNECYARYICGGVCQVDYGYRKKKNDSLCEINKHLYKLAVRFFVETSKTSIYDIIKSCVDKIAGYEDIDRELVLLAEQMRGRYSYSELKLMKDMQDSKYFMLLNNIKGDYHD